MRYTLRALILGCLFLGSTAAAETTYTLNWDAPTTNVDGTPLSDLAAYGVYSSETSGVYTTPQATVTQPGTTYSGVIPRSFTARTRYFTVDAVDTTGNRSAKSNEVSRTFAADPSAQLTVTIAGSGTVTSTPPGINCGADCTERYFVGDSVTLAAVPAVGFRFDGWTNGCAGTGNCTRIIDADLIANAVFVAAPVVAPTVTVHFANNNTNPARGNSVVLFIDVANGPITSLTLHKGLPDVSPWPAQWPTGSMSNVFLVTTAGVQFPLCLNTSATCFPADGTYTAVVDYTYAGGTGQSRLTFTLGVPPPPPNPAPTAPSNLRVQ